MQGILGKVITYSLSTNLEINWDELLADCKQLNVPEYVFPITKKEYLNIRDIRESILRTMKKNYAVSLRDNGGCFYIPHYLEDDWEDYESALTNYDGVVITSLDLADTESNKRQIVQALLNDVRESYRELNKKITGKKGDKQNLTITVMFFLNLLVTKQLDINMVDCISRKLQTIQDKVSIYERVTNVDLSYIKNNVNKSIKEFNAIFMKKRFIDNW